MKTAVEWFIEQLKDMEYDLRLIPNTIEQAKEMEKEHIKDAWENGKKSTQCKTPMCERKTGIGYYNKTFKQQEQ
jgi:hypothetical protein